LTGRWLRSRRRTPIRTRATTRSYAQPLRQASSWPNQGSDGPPMMAAPEAENSGPDPGAILRNPRFVAVLVLAALVGVVASLVAWVFLDLINQMQPWIFTDLPQDVLGFDTTPNWWYVVVLAIAGVITAFAIVRLPGRGGHVPADGLTAKTAQAVDAPGVALAGI